MFSTVSSISFRLRALIFEVTAMSIYWFKCLRLSPLDKFSLFRLQNTCLKKQIPFYTLGFSSCLIFSVIYNFSLYKLTHSKPMFHFDNLGPEDQGLLCFQEV